MNKFLVMPERISFDDRIVLERLSYRMASTLGDTSMSNGLSLISFFLGRLQSRRRGLSLNQSRYAVRQILIIQDIKQTTRAGSSGAAAIREL